MPDRNVKYVAFTDPSGGSSDSFTLAIAHKSGDTAVLDLLREVRPPFSPEAVTAEFAEQLKRFRISAVDGDAYAGEWPREQFRKRGIFYKASEQSKSDLYRDLMPLINARAVDLLDHDRLLTQLCGLERRTARGGRDSIDHPKGAHDDIANCAAGALVRAMALRGSAADFRWRSVDRQQVANVGHASIKRIHAGWGAGAAAPLRHSDEGLRRGVVPWPASAPDPFDPCINAYSTDGWKRTS
jgi:hypothetical protein